MEPGTRGGGGEYDIQVWSITKKGRIWMKLNTKDYPSLHLDTN